MSDYIIEVSNLIKTYKIYNKQIDRLKEAISVTRTSYSREFNALENISFNVKKGENIGIIGTNGSGKSTLLKIITGVLANTAGEVKVNGKVSALLELGAGFNPEYTGMENIYLNGLMMGFTREQMEEKIEGIVKFAGIGDFVYQPVKTYSSGMFARLAFAVAINVEPDILIVDEALSVGDIRFQEKCMHRMKTMMSGGTTVLFVSHDTHAIKKFCTRAIWLHQGTLVGDGKVGEIAELYLDYLKKGDIVLKQLQGESEQETVVESVEKPFEAGESVAEVIAVHIRNKDGQTVYNIDADMPIQVEVVYDVYDIEMELPVLGVAIRGGDEDYICGVNTLIDKIAIPWKYGRNRVALRYPTGLLTRPGKYYFDTAIMDETASVNIHYFSMVKEIVVNEDNYGEGRYIIPHRWEG